MSLTALFRAEPPVEVVYAHPTRAQLRAALAACNKAPYTLILAHVRASVVRQLATYVCPDCGHQACYCHWYD